MSTIAMKAVATATFTAEQKVCLEEVLIAMLYSGTLTEEDAMLLNDSNSFFELREATRQIVIEIEQIAVICDAVDGMHLYDAINADIDTNDDLKWQMIEFDDIPF